MDLKGRILGIDDGDQKNILTNTDVTGVTSETPYSENGLNNQRIYQNAQTQGQSQIIN